MTQNRCNFVDI